MQAIEILRQRGLTSEWEQLIALAVNRIVEILGEDVECIYLRGSCAAGSPVPDLSDIDLVICCRRVTSGQASELHAGLKNFTIGNGARIAFDLDVITTAEFLRSPRNNGLRFLTHAHGVSCSEVRA